MPSLNLKAKFAIVAGTMILAVAIIITTFLTRQQEQTIREELVHRAVALTENLAYNCQLPLVAENRTSLRRLATGLLKEGEVSYVHFAGADGTELLRSGEVSSTVEIVAVHDVRQHPSGTRSAWIRTADGHTYLDVHTTVAVPALSDEDDILSSVRQAKSGSLGDVRLGMTVAAAEKRIAHLRLLAALLGVAIALAGSLLAAGLIHFLTRPLSHLMEGNRRVARGDFGLRLEVRGSDEFGRLAGSYNQMADEIERSRVLAESYLASLRANAERLEEANRALQNTNVELAKASRMKSEFLAVMSHELRTPLNVIIGFSEVMLDETFGPLNPKQGRYASNILTSGRHLLTLINDILDLSKVEAGKMQVIAEPFDLRQSLEEIQSLVRHLAAKKRVQVRCGEVPAVTPVTDQKLFKQVMFNLLSNAIKFTPEGGEVGLRVRHLDGEALRVDPVSRTLPAERRADVPARPLLLVEVHDTGVGIDPEDYDKIFVAFQQLDASYARNQEGTGLGLALTRKLVRLLGGEIWFSSQRGEGTRFWFYVPSEFTDQDHEPGEGGVAVPHDAPELEEQRLSKAAVPPAPVVAMGAEGGSQEAVRMGADPADWPWARVPVTKPRAAGAGRARRNAASGGRKRAAGAAAAAGAPPPQCVPAGEEEKA